MATDAGCALTSKASFKEMGAAAAMAGNALAAKPTERISYIQVSISCSACDPH